MSTHPEISSLIRLKDQARDLRIERKYESLLETLYALMDELKTEDQDKNTLDSIDKEFITIANFKYPGEKRKWLNDRKNIYLKWYRIIIQILWDKHYLENEKYGMVYPASMKKITRN